MGSIKKNFVQVFLDYTLSIIGLNTVYKRLFIEHLQYFEKDLYQSELKNINIFILIKHVFRHNTIHGLTCKNIQNDFFLGIPCILITIFFFYLE